MRRQPRIACAVSWVPLSIPIFADPTSNFRDQFLQHHAGVVGDLLVGSRHEAGRVVSLSAYDCQARAAALDALVPFVPRPGSPCVSPRSRSEWRPARAFQKIRAYSTRRTSTATGVVLVLATIAALGAAA